MIPSTNTFASTARMSSTKKRTLSRLCTVTLLGRLPPAASKLAVDQAPPPGRVVEDRRHAWVLCLGFAPQDQTSTSRRAPSSRTRIAHAGVNCPCITRAMLSCGRARIAWAIPRPQLFDCPGNGHTQATDSWRTVWTGHAGWGSLVLMEQDAYHCVGHQSQRRH